MWQAPHPAPHPAPCLPATNRRPWGFGVKGIPKARGREHRTACAQLREAQARPIMNQKRQRCKHPHHHHHYAFVSIKRPGQLSNEVPGFRRELRLALALRRLVMESNSPVRQARTTWSLIFSCRQAYKFGQQAWPWRPHKRVNKTKTNCGCSANRSHFT